MAAIPSPLPIAPIPSVLVTLRFTASRETSRVSATTEAAGGADLTTTTVPSFSASDGALGNEADAADGAGGGDAAAESLPMEDEALSMLQEAPPLLALPGESDLDGLEDFASEMIEALRGTDDTLTSLPCYQVAFEDDDLEIATSFRVPYPGEDGEERYAIAFSDAGTPTSESLVRLYDPVTCEPLAATTGSP